MQLSGKQKNHLRGLAHGTASIVQMGKSGLSNELLGEIDRHLAHHELVKVRVACDDRDDFKDTARNIALRCSASIVQLIGHTAVLYRSSEAAKIVLPT